MNKRVLMSCDTLADIRFKAEMDGGLAILVHNCVAYANEKHLLERFGLCGHSGPALEDFMDLLESKIDPELWVEE
jgi:hypothetical protein